MTRTSLRVVDPPAGGESQIIGGTYRIVGALGRGSMGVVYEVEHLRLGKRFALKLARGDGNHESRHYARFHKEARALAAVCSDNVVRIVDCGENDDGSPYLVMERLVGSDLRSVLAKEGPLSIERSLRVILAACRGLRAVHLAGIVHRDLKPANLFLSMNEDGVETAHVLDFGVARTESGNGTHGGAVIGTIRYMAPEQLMDAKRVGPHSDVYAVTAILYECLAGRPPHRAETVEELVFEILNHAPRRLTELRSEASEELADVVARGLARSIGERFSTVEQFQRALAAASESCRTDADSRTGRDTSSLQWPAGAGAMIEDGHSLSARFRRFAAAPRVWGPALTVVLLCSGLLGLARRSASELSRSRASPIDALEPVHTGPAVVVVREQPADANKVNGNAEHEAPLASVHSTAEDHRARQPSSANQAHRVPRSASVDARMTSTEPASLAGPEKRRASSERSPSGPFDTRNPYVD